MANLPSISRARNTIRTCDLLRVMQMLYRLSYASVVVPPRIERRSSGLQPDAATT